jgi:hypothetical protein
MPSDSRRINSREIPPHHIHSGAPRALAGPLCAPTLSVSQRPAFALIIVPPVWAQCPLRSSRQPQQRRERLVPACLVEGGHRPPCLDPGLCGKVRFRAGHCQNGGRVSDHLSRLISAGAGCRPWLRDGGGLYPIVANAKRPKMDVALHFCRKANGVDLVAAADAIPADARDEASAARKIQQKSNNSERPRQQIFRSQHSGRWQTS